MIGVGCIDDIEAVDAHGAGRQLDRLAGAGQVVGAHPLHQDGRIGRRDLVNFADEGRQGLLDRSARGPHVRAGGHLALAVEGCSGLAPGQGEAISLVGVDHEADGLGRLAQGDGQDAGGQGIEGAGVTGFLGVEQAAHAADGRR